MHVRPGCHDETVQKLRVRIHRGSREIGGNCIEIEAQGSRIVLDVGRPLDAASDEELSLPPVDHLGDGGDPGLLGIIISHPHQDHYGLVHLASPKVPVYMGEAAHRILREAAFFTRVGLRSRPAGFLRHREPFEIGPFKITPFLNDHSAFDAYSMLIEAGEQRVFYTGDFRGHGRKAGIFEQLLRNPPGNIDVLLMEGTHVRADSDGSERGPTEQEVENDCVETFKATPGAVLACYSAQNIDALVTLYRAAIRSGRDFVMDLYTASIAAATGCPTVPQANWDHVRVYVPRSQKMKVLQEQAFARTEAVRASRIYPAELFARRAELVMTFRQSMANEVTRMGCLVGAHLVWSLWPGYLKDPSGKKLLAQMDQHGVRHDIHHASGHAHIPDLQRLAAALAPRRLVPIHSFATDRFSDFFPRVKRHGDGEWWDA